jgi:glycine betaine/proline transport system ATP-binding protein
MTQNTPEGGPRAAPAPAPEIEFRDVHTRWEAYGGKPAIEGIRAEALAGFSFTLPAGKSTVLLGDRKSGKTLVALHLLLEVPLESGQLLSNGESVWDMPEEKRMMLHDQVGTMIGDSHIRRSHINPGVTVRENLLAQLRRSTKVTEPEADIEEWLHDYDLAGIADKLPDKTSSSARRRLAMALALAWDPALVVLDDLGAAIDYAHFKPLNDAAVKWHQRTGATVLITVRSLAMAKLVSHQVAILRDGKVLECGPPDEVLRGVSDDESFERRFHTKLGGFSEYDPDRLASHGTDPRHVSRIGLMDLGRMRR